MDTHKNAPLTPRGREAMVRSVVDGGLSQAAAARQFNVTPKTVAKWVKRFRAEGVTGLTDRSSRPHSSPNQTPAAACAAVETLRRQRYIGKQIAAEVGDIDGNRQPHPAPARPEQARRSGAGRAGAPLRARAPGEIIHIDIGKKLGQVPYRSATASPAIAPAKATPCGLAGNIVHLAIDDHSRVAYSEILPNEKRASCLRFPLQRLALLSNASVSKSYRVMTDNGTASDPVATPRHCACSKSSICAPSPTRRKPMARPSASSKPACANGPMPAPTTPQTTAPQTCPPGCTAITGIDRTAV